MPARKSVPIDWAQIRAPIPQPGAIYCAGANYGDHVREMNAAQGKGPEPDPHTLGLKPWHFIKSAHSVVGPGAAVKIPPASKKLDWEVELAAVIGKTAKDVSEADALAYVAGYTVSNDLSARDFGLAPAGAEHLALLQRLARAQELRRLVSARTVDRAGE